MNALRTQCCEIAASYITLNSLDEIIPSERSEVLKFNVEHKANREFNAEQLVQIQILNHLP